MAIEGGTGSPPINIHPIRTDDDLRATYERLALIFLPRRVRWSLMGRLSVGA